MTRFLSPRAWLDAIRNRWLGRHAKVEPPRLADRNVTAAQIDAAVAAVPPFEREIFYLYRIDGMTYPQIAARFGISERRVERALVDALGCMRRALQKMPPDDE